MLLTWCFLLQILYYICTKGRDSKEHFTVIRAVFTSIVYISCLVFKWWSCHFNKVLWKYNRVGKNGDLSFSCQELSDSQFLIALNNFDHNTVDTQFHFSAQMFDIEAKCHFEMSCMLNPVPESVQSTCLSKTWNQTKNPWMWCEHDFIGEAIDEMKLKKKITMQQHSTCINTTWIKTGNIFLSILYPTVLCDISS